MAPRIFLPILLVSCLLTACAMPGFVRTGPEPPSRPSDTFKVLTHNALHGLEVDRFWVRRAEAPEAHRARFRRRIEGLAHAQPDLILLQEVNPFPQMAVDYVQALQSFGLTYSEVHQVDSCGLSLAPGLALLPGLNNGLVILAKAPLQIRKFEGVKLSGGIGRCTDSWGVQFGEFRYALIAEVTNPGSQMRYLVATAHFHSGIERDARILHELMEVHRQGRLIRYDDLMGELVRGQERRLQELHTLVEALRK